MFLPSVPPQTAMSIADALAEVRAHLEAAARAAGRDPSGVRLVAVSKTFPVDAVLEAYAAGQRHFGENRVQEGLAKVEATSQLPGIRWHLLGHLQSNKAKKAAAAFGTIQSLDGVDLLRRLDQGAVDAGTTPELLIQVDLAGEVTKFGARPDEVPPIFEEAARCRAARVVGLMLLPPAPDTPEDARPWFRRLREHRDRWLSAGVPAPMLRELSMGMSGDYAVAVEEGATIVRVGTAIFGRRDVQR